ncbi:hypothetical protein ACS0TY_008356 [Phlomoides rotata]
MWHSSPLMGPSMRFGPNPVTSFLKAIFGQMEKMALMKHIQDKNKIEDFCSEDATTELGPCSNK